MIQDLGEFGLIDMIKGIVPAGGAGLVVGIGDDAAAFRPAPGRLTLATCDIQVEGRHFLRERATAYQLGRRSAAINLSDIGAMGGEPRHALVSLALPKDTPVAWVQELYRGLTEELARCGAGVIGGNLSSIGSHVVVDITLIGEAEEAHLVRRSGGRPGDVVLVTGTLGASSAGLKALERGLDPADPAAAACIAAHLTPVPRVREGAAIGRSGLATAMIDISDGLAGDLGHICRASNVGARLFAERIPIDAATRAVAKSVGADPLDLALHGGEDFQLAFACPRSAAGTLLSLLHEATGTAASEVGMLTTGTGITLVRPGGREAALVKGGWDHFGINTEGADHSRVG